MCSVFKWEIAYVLGVHITALSRRGPCLFFVHGVCFCRCCVTETIPASYLEQVRHKYLNYDTRAQRKDFLLQCTDPRSRYTPNAFVVFAMVAFSWFPCICAYVLVSVSLCSVCVCVCVTSTMATVLKQACQVETFICYVCFTHLQERVLSCRRCLPNLLERSDKLARMFNRSSQLVCARAPS